MATKRSGKSGWIAPRSGGYSANSSTSRSKSAVTGRSVSQSTVQRHAGDTVSESTKDGSRKPTPPKGPAAASDARARRDSNGG